MVFPGALLLQISAPFPPLIFHFPIPFFSKRFFQASVSKLFPSMRFFPVVFPTSFSRVFLLSFSSDCSFLFPGFIAYSFFSVLVHCRSDARCVFPFCLQLQAQLAFFRSHLIGLSALFVAPLDNFAFFPNFLLSNRSR